MIDAVGIENPCLDLALNLDRLPSPNGGARLDDYTWQGGGKISTGLIAAARLGIKCMQIGTVGDDILGRAVLRDIVRHGIDARYIQVMPGTTSFAVVMCDQETQGRSIIYKTGSVPPVREDQVCFEALSNTKFFFLAHLSGINLAAARHARAYGAKVLMDADHPHDGMLENIGLVDYFIASEFVYDEWFPGSTEHEKNCALIRAKGPETVVFTRGEKGCIGMDGGGFFNLPAYDVEVADTLGAGDVFHGAFLAGLARGWTAKRTADFSNAVSAIKCTRAGGRAGIPDFHTAVRFMETGFIDYGDIDRRVEYYKRGLEHA